MKVVRSSVIGFCFGVSNTVNMALECLRVAQKKNLPCYSIGELIHNRDVVEFFTEKGLQVIEKPTDAPAGVALIRAHGIADKDKWAFVDSGFEVFDSTCPTVQKGANALRNAYKNGKHLVVLGFRGHAETIGLMGLEDEEGHLLSSILLTSADEAREFVNSNVFKEDESLFVVTQTTFPRDVYEEISSILKAKYKNIVFGNVPCPACRRRIEASVETASLCDAAVVLGGVKSANTKNLAHEIEKIGKPVFLVENAADLKEDLLTTMAQFDSIALISGSSTPIGVIEEVEKVLQAL